MYNEDGQMFFDTHTHTRKGEGGREVRAASHNKTTGKQEEKQTKADNRQGEHTTSRQNKGRTRGEGGEQSKGEPAKNNKNTAARQLKQDRKGQGQTHSWGCGKGREKVRGGKGGKREEERKRTGRRREGSLPSNACCIHGPTREKRDGAPSYTQVSISIQGRTQRRGSAKLQSSFFSAFHFKLPAIWPFSVGDILHVTSSGRRIHVPAKIWYDHLLFCEAFSGFHQVWLHFFAGVSFAARTVLPRKSGGDNNLAIIKFHFRVFTRSAVWTGTVSLTCERRLYALWCPLNGSRASGAEWGTAIPRTCDWTSCPWEVAWGRSVWITKIGIHINDV